ncbi:PaiB family negative transcriptional regulator [Murinocardiopsis flavida]|uniref:PaiB family negative transcriptional regulator n=1 Tax=Murinocardiopsis flavida TaxID=645275 RepID=A0A2P8DL86_9ACTN|nr:FMN-binding negative transcriptional regulator [Murinocardiopsis flavida]PSK97984.1 PaiB family negative transcriptional regulator [Murinocardiopsis flavida]
MYVPRHFDPPDDDAVHALLSAQGAADLVTWTPQGLKATLVPFVFDAGSGPHGSLIAHLARNNDQWHSAAPGTEALAIVRGPDAYISPSWYAAKAEHGRVVPTWNYVTAHVYGTFTVHDDPAWTEDAVRRLTERHEAGRERPWSVDDAPRPFVDGQLRAVVGVELAITRVEAKWKLSQNRGATDVDGVVAGLGEGGAADRAVAAEMARARTESRG